MVDRRGLKQLDGKVAVVTGAASGIGFALCERFGAEGMRLVMADVEERALTEAAARLRLQGREVIAIPTDVSQSDDVHRLAAATYEAYGAAHVLCNNAGVVKSARTWELTADDWKWLIDVNLWGVIHGIRAFVPRMLAGGESAHIVNTASVIALLPMVNKAPYAAAKAGVMAVSEALQVDLDADEAPIGVSVLFPGFIPTRITESERNRPSALTQSAVRKSPSSIGGIQSTMSAAEVAEVVVEAIRNGRFWIVTHPEYLDLVEQRAHGIRAGARPVPAPVW